MIMCGVQPEEGTSGGQSRATHDPKDNTVIPGGSGGLTHRCDDS